MMKKKSVRLIAGAVVVVCLGGAYYGLKIYNEKAEQKEEEASEGETILDVDTDTLAGISFQIDGETVSFTKQEDGTWQMDEDADFPVDGSALLTPLAALEPLKSVRTLTDISDDSEYGLDDPQNVITLTDEDGEETVLTIGDNNDVTGNDYLMLDNDSATIYTISTTLRTGFSEDLYDYAKSEELPEFSASSVTGIRVSKPDGSYDLYLEDAVWMVSGDGSAEKADSDLANGLASDLAGLSYVDFLDYNCTDFSEYGLDEPAAEITVTYTEEAEGETEEEATEAESEDESEEENTEAASEDGTEEETGTQSVEKTVTFLIGDTDESGNYYVRMDGSSEVHTFSSSQLEDLLNDTASDLVSTEEEETETEAETDTDTETETDTETDTEESVNAGTETEEGMDTDTETGIGIQ